MRTRFWLKWLTSIVGDRRNGKPVKRRPRLVPRLEYLEERLTPTTFTPTTGADLASIGQSTLSPADVNSQGRIISQGGAITLRSAIIAANANPAADNTIDLGSLTYTLSIAPVETNNGGILDKTTHDATSGSLDVTGPLTITGDGAAHTIIEAGTTSSNGIDQIFDINPFIGGTTAPGFAASITGVTLQFGQNASNDQAADGEGGAIDFDAGPDNAGSLTLTNDVITQNQTTNGDGGAVALFDGGTVSISGTTFSNNTANSQGGGNTVLGGAIYVGYSATVGTLTLSNNTIITGNQIVAPATASTGGGIDDSSGGLDLTIHGGQITNNQAPSDGGGIDAAQFTIDQGTLIDGNTSGGNGGGIAGGNAASASSITDATITNNSASTGGGGVFFNAGTSNTISDSRLFNNTSTSGASAVDTDAGNSATATADANWWGSNADPHSQVGAGVTIDNWLELTLTRGAAQITANSSTSLTATVVSATTSSVGTTPVSGTALEGLNLTFAAGSVAGTSVSPTSVAISNGTASTTFFSGGTAGMAKPTVKLDAATPSTTITINVPPSLKMTAPQATSTTNYNQVFLSANGTSVTHVQFQDSTDGGSIWNDVGPVISGTSTFSTATPALPDNTYEVRALDNDDNTVFSTPVTFTVDTTSSAVSMTAPGNNSYTNSNKPTLSANAFNNTDGSALASVQFQYSSDGGTNWNNAGPAQTTGPFHFTFTTNLADGIYEARAIATDAAGDEATATPVTFTVDTTPPTVTIGAPTGGQTHSGQVYANAASTITYTLTYFDTNFDQSAPTTADIILNTPAGNGSATVASVTEVPGSLSSTGEQWTVTLDDFTGNGPLGISVTAGTSSDLANNVDKGAGPSTTFTVDTIDPTVTITGPTGGQTHGGTVYADASSNISYTVTYFDTNFAQSTLTNGDITLNAPTGNASATTVTVTPGTITSTGETFTVTLSSFTGNGPLGISVTAGASSDLAGNVDTGTSPSSTFTVDTVVPTASLSAAPPNLNSSSAAATTTTLTVTYADSGSGINTSTFGTANISVNNGATVTGFTPNGNAVTYTITSPAANWGSSFQGTYTVSLNASVTDLAGNPVAANANLASFVVGSADPTATLTTAPPAYLNGSVANANTTTLTVTYSPAAPAVMNAATFGTANISVNNGAKVTGFTTNGNAVTYTITAPAATWGASFQGTYTVSLNASAEDNLGNPVGSIANFASFTVDTIAPTATLTTAPPAFINQTSAGTSTTTLTVTYADSGSGINTSTFGTANISVNNGATVTGFAPNGNAVTYTITAPAATWGTSHQGTYSVSLNASVKDLAGNPVAANANLASFLVDTIAPTVAIGTPTETLVAGALHISYTITYADVNFEDSTLTVGNVTLNKTSSASATVGVDTGTGATRTVTLTGVTGSGSLGITLAAGTAVDFAGNLAGAAGPSATVTVQAPTITSTNHAAFTAGTPFSFPLTASGTPTAITFSLTSAPKWLTINGSGQLVGTPPVVGKVAYPVVFKVNASNGVSPANTQTFTLTVNPPIHFSLAALPVYYVGLPYAVGITTSGGTGTVTVSYTVSGTLPAGLTIKPASPTSKTIVISGTTRALGTVTIKLTAIDSVGAETVITLILTGVNPNRRGW